VSSPGRIIAGGNPENRPSGRPCTEPGWHKPESPRSDSERGLCGPSEVEQALSPPQNQYTERRDTAPGLQRNRNWFEQRNSKRNSEETLQCKIVPGVPPASERESIQSLKLTDSVQGSGARGASAPLRGSVAINGNNPTKAGLLAGIQWLESTGE
jgi:hypothetical protein